jgi:hypothetical protein
MLSSGSGINSVVHQLSCFGFHCAWLLGLVSLPCPLSLGQGQWSVRRLPAVSMLWWFADCFSILQCHLTLDVAHWLKRWALWTATCFISCSGLSPARCWSFWLSSLCLLKVHTEIRSLPLPPFSGVFLATPPLCCVLVLSSLFIVQVFLFVCLFSGVGGWSVCLGDYASLS